MTVQEKIRQARLSAGLLQRELGELCGYTENAQCIVARWEAGIRPVPKNKLIVVAKTLNLPLESLLSNE